MNLPPALTWLQLFPSRAACVCDGAAMPPSWLAEKLREFASNGGSDALRVQVSQGKAFHNMVELPQWESAVAINCPGVTAPRMEAAGFNYARRYAVMPSLSNARWFIPLDSGAMAAAGFSLYTPARRSAHWKKRAASLMARFRLPYWYRDQIVIAQRQPPPLENKLAALFPGIPFRLALSAGAPEPAINRKASAVVLAPGGKILAFVKIAGSDISRRILEHEATMLPAIADRGAVAEAAPRLLFAGEVDGRYITVQTPLAGSVAAAKMTPAHRQFLSSLRNGQVKSAAATQMIATLPARLAALMPARPDLSAALDEVMTILESLQVPSTIIHGDFAPWNLRSHAGRIAAFDWEYGELDGLPLVDEAHFFVQLGYQLGGWNAERAHAFFNEIAESRPLDLAPAQVRAIQAVYIIDIMARLLGEGYDAADDMLQWYRQLLGRLVNIKREAVPA